MWPRKSRVTAPGLFVLAATACSGAEPGAAMAPIDVTPLPPAPALVGARWIDASGATLVGPSTSDGTLVLLGGRRALATSAGVKSESVAAPEALWDIVDVPIGDRHEIVAAGSRAVYRLPDPLGAPVSLGRGAISRIGAGSGGVYVWTSASDAPTFVDLGGHSNAVAQAEPLRAIAFRDAKAGAAIFAVSGLAATTDGGATFRLVAGQHEEPVRVTGIRRGPNGELRAFVFGDGPDGAIDLEHASLAPLARASDGAKELPLVTWIRATGRDPLEVAASSGIEVAGGALVASHGLLGKVDLKTGALSEMSEFARGKWMNPCGAARAGQGAFIACSLSEGDGEMFDPFGIIRVRLDEAPLKIEKPIVVRNGEAELRSGPSGGAMLLGSCGRDDEAIACVKQPDGKWIGIKGEVELADRGAGPLADGRVAFVRGLVESEVEPDLGADDIGKGHRLRVAALDRDGKEKTVALVGWEGKAGDLRVMSPIEEDEAHALHFILGEDQVNPYVVIAAPGKELAPARRIAGATFATIHAGRGVAFGESVQTSLDGGATWNSVELPPRIVEFMPHGGGLAETTQVSEVGFRLGNALRIGWGPAEPNVEPLAREAAALPVAPAMKRGAEQVLRCETLGPAQSTPPPLGGPELKDSLASPNKPKDGVRRDRSSWTGSRWGMLDTVAVLEVDSVLKADAQHPEASPSKPTPTTWSLRWLQPTAIGDRVHSVTLAPPKVGETSVTGLRSANASGNRALFTVKLVNKQVVVRARAGAQPEVREIPVDLAPTSTGDVVFGEGRGEPIVWLHEASLVVWFENFAPRVAYELSPGGVRHLGEPTADGVPLLVGGNGWTLFRVLPLGEKETTRVALAGFTKLAFAANDAGDLPACRGPSKGVRVWAFRSRGLAEVDHVPEAASSSVLELRINPGEACVASVASLLAPRDRPSGPAPGAAAKDLGGFASFVRADLVGDKAEGGDRGPANAAKIRRLRCKLSP